MTRLCLLLLLILTGKAWGQVLKVDLEKDLPKTGIVNLYEINSKKLSQLPVLSRLKYSELRGQWSECSRLAPRAFTQSKDLKGWVALTWLNCAEQERKTKNLTSTNKALETLKNHRLSLQEGPWAKALTASWREAEYAVVESLVEQEKPQAAVKAAALLSQGSALSAAQRAFLYGVLGQQALTKKDYREARFFFEESLDQKETNKFREKLNFVRAAQGDSSAPEKPAAENKGLSADEVIEARVRQALQQNEVIAALKDILLLLNEYSDSGSAQRLRDKPMEIYNSVVEDGKVKVLNQLEAAHASRLSEWAQAMYRRADYKGSFRLAQKALGKDSESPQTASLLLLAGRSAHFLGLYSKAQSYYSKLIETQYGSEEAADALFRSALIYFRTKEYGNAVSRLERLATLRNERYELNGMYWLYRSLQKSSPERAEAVGLELISRYPFSYYGLRIFAEQNTQPWYSSPQPLPPVNKVIYLAGSQVAAWKRFVALSAAGWVSEAQKELEDRPHLWDPAMKIALARRLVERLQFPLAIRLVNQAMESEPAYRKKEFITLAYPKTFQSLFEQEAQRYQLAPDLLQSLVRQESAFNLRATSRSNALGLMQMIPSTAEEVAGRLNLKIELPQDMFRPEVNIPMGSFYLAQVLKQFGGSLPMGLAAYNAGPTRFKTWLDSRPETAELKGQMSDAVEEQIWFDELPWSETSFYIKAILRNKIIYGLIAGEASAQKKSK